MGYYKRHKPLTFEDCEALMATARNRANGKPVANNTRLYAHLGSFALRLHNTDILLIYPEGWQINSGGYHTVTTKQRLNDFGPVGISQRDFTWYVGTADGDVPFCDWMFVDMDRKVWPTKASYHDSLEHDISEAVE